MKFPAKGENGDELLKKMQANPLFSGFSLAGGTGLAMQIGNKIPERCHEKKKEKYINEFK